MELTLGTDGFEPIHERAFVVNGSLWVWVVLEGAVDLFVQQSRHGELNGPRAYVTRVPSGEAIFGVMAEMPGDFQLVAVPVPNSRIGRTTQSNLQWRMERGAGAEAIVGQIEKWVMRLAEAASTKAQPKKFTVIEAGQRMETGEKPEIVAPLNGVVWAKLLAGSSHFLAERDLPFPNGHLFPLCSRGWLKVDAASILDVHQTGHWHTLDSSWDGLQSFHEAVLKAVVLSLEAEEEKEQARLSSKLESTRETVQTAFSWLARAFDRNPDFEREPGHVPDLTAALRAVGRQLGVKIADLPDVSNPRKYKEPVLALAKASSVPARRVVLKPDWWKSDAGHLVAFRAGSDAPVALLRRASGHYDLFDPAQNRYLRVTAAVAATLSGTAYAIYRPFPEGVITLRELLRFGVAGCKRDLTIILAMGMGTGILGLVTPIVMGAMFDSAIPGAQRDQVLTLFVFLLMSAICSGLFSITRNFAVQRLQGKMDATLQSAAWDRLLRLPATFFRKYSSGDLASRSMAFKEIGATLSGPVLSSLLYHAFSLISLVLLFVYNAQLAILGSVLLAIAAAVSLLCLRVYLRLFRQIMALRGRVQGILMELVNGVPKFRVSGTEGKAFAVWARAAAERRRYVVKSKRLVVVLASFQRGWPVISTAAVYYLGVKVLGGSGEKLSTGSFLAFLTVFNQVMMAALSVFGTVQQLLSIVPMYERARPILETLPEVNRSKVSPGELRGDIEVNHLTFRYTPDGPAILRELSFKVKAGESVAIVGPSGCGKSTLFRLLLGFERPEAGAVYFDGQDLAGLDVQAVREQIGTVLQNGKIASGSLFNLIIGSSPLTIDDAWEAARMTGLDKDIQGMPMGMHTAVSEGGGTLSGGQRQRLMIAAAIVTRPRILFFDEATSALDNETQATVTRSVESLRATRIVIAHRLSTVINADRILVFDRGSVVQSGTYQELVSQPGPFRDLAARQLA